jgi:hypothetical protein
MEEFDTDHWLLAAHFSQSQELEYRIRANRNLERTGFSPMLGSIVLLSSAIGTSRLMEA